MLLESSWRFAIPANLAVEVSLSSRLRRRFTGLSPTVLLPRMISISCARPVSRSLRFTPASGMHHRTPASGCDTNETSKTHRFSTKRGSQEDSLPQFDVTIAGELNLD